MRWGKGRKCFSTSSPSRLVGGTSTTRTMSSSLCRRKAAGSAAPTVTVTKGRHTIFEHIFHADRDLKMRWNDHRCNGSTWWAPIKHRSSTFDTNAVAADVAVAWWLNFGSVWSLVRSITWKCRWAFRNQIYGLRDCGTVDIYRRVMVLRWLMSFCNASSLICLHILMQHRILWRNLI